ncbi:oxidoreductase [Nocardioides sp. Root1257]|uniref:oxidoreductase n=1 Tax=unclassified Nocardioides TaxID=2615069 RepID=UPI0006F9114B|nr:MULTISPECIES: oxidoreductase [unclassified Nocardioides]KQW48637.1 oxidoreductase [Nocardioides sp. Root1257]KRC47813.1 oxidoreductase [Nocardioides sp. Root224]
MSGLPTAAGVLDGIDLSGRTALVTGGYSGIGTEVVRALAGAGAHVLAPARRPGKAEEVLAGIDGVQVGELDLADQDSVATYADGVLGSGRPLDYVIGNAGVMACPETRVGPAGRAEWELQLATNHLGHYALVNRVWPAIAASGRVISVSSTGHHLSDIRWGDPWFAVGYDKWLAYGQSKTANVLFAVHLDRLARDRGVRAFSLHPGAILTPLGRHLQAEDLDAVMTLDADGQPLLPDFRSPEEGAATAVWAATSPTLDGRGGLYLEDCGIAEVVPPGPQATSGVKDYAVDPEAAARLWAWSAEVTGVDAFA